MHIFFADIIIGNEYNLNTEESKHCTRVLRLKTGDTVYLINGKGLFCKGFLIAENDKHCKVHIVESQNNFGERKAKLHIAIAPTKSNDRLEWFLEKAVEIGIDEITPLLCERSERKVVNNERLNKLLIAAIKQCGRAYLPKINEITKVATLLKAESLSDKFIAHLDNNNCMPFSKVYNKDKDATILIGPEGDFTEKEIEMSQKQNFKLIKLGDFRLRTETAALVVCQQFNMMNDYL